MLMIDYKMDRSKCDQSIILQSKNAIDLLSAEMQNLTQNNCLLDFYPILIISFDES
jgi:hypothetical protein